MILICGLFEGKYFHVLFPHLKLGPVHHQNNSGMLEQKNTLANGGVAVQERGLLGFSCSSVERH